MIVILLPPGYSGMDEAAALFILKTVVPHFITIASEQARTLPDGEGMKSTMKQNAHHTCAVSYQSLVMCE